MVKKIIELITLKGIVTLIVTLTLAIGFFLGKVGSDQFVPLATIVFMFYFHKKDGED